MPSSFKASSFFKESLATASNMISKPNASGVVFGQDAFQKCFALDQWALSQIKTIEIQYGERINTMEVRAWRDRNALKRGRPFSSSATISPSSTAVVALIAFPTCFNCGKRSLKLLCLRDTGCVSSNGPFCFSIKPTKNLLSIMRECFKLRAAWKLTNDLTKSTKQQTCDRN